MFIGIVSLNFILSLIFLFKFKILFPLVISILFLILIIFCWFRDIFRESLFQGKHSFLVERGLQIGIILFIFSEVIFFFSFFWTFFHRRVSPSFEIGRIWPPLRIEGISPFEIPLLNTFILLRSGVSITWGHYLLLNNKDIRYLIGLTVLLGGYFTFLQFFEYREASFSFRDSVYGRVFFIATGFHGLHVIIGSVLLGYSIIRLIIHHFNLLNPIGLELSIWYWHFVDVVWLFLFSFIYWWGI